MKYRSNNLADRATRRDLSNLMRTTNTRACATALHACRPKKKLIIKSNSHISLHHLPPSSQPPIAKKNSIRSKSNRFCDKAEKLISQKRQFRVLRPPPSSSPRYLCDNLSSSETSYHVSLFRDASACNCNRSSQ